MGPEAFISLLGTSEGGSIEFENALEEISDGELVPHKYMAQINPNLTKARAFMFLGKFQESEDTFLDSIQWSNYSSDSHKFLYADHYWRAFSRNLHGHAMRVREPKDKRLIYQIWSSAIDDMKTAKQHTTDSGIQKAMDNWMDETIAQMKSLEYLD